MAKQLSDAGSSLTRRRFLLVASLGLGAAAALAGPLKGLLWGSGKAAPLASSSLPGEDSIFHPRRDARLEAYEKKSRGA